MNPVVVDECYSVASPTTEQLSAARRVDSRIVRWNGVVFKQQFLFDCGCLSNTTRIRATIDMALSSSNFDSVEIIVTSTFGQ